MIALTALQRKLLRDLMRLWPQALAIAMVMAAGAATLVLGIGAHGSLAETRAAYYERNRFADVFADLTRAPKVYADEIAKIPGVAAVEVRIAKVALLDLPGVAEPASGDVRVHSRFRRVDAQFAVSAQRPVAAGRG